MTQTKTNVLNGVQWVEAPTQPKTQSKTQLYLRRSTPVTIVAETQLITNPTKEQVDEILITLCRVMQNTMSKFKVHAIYGKIALVEFEPTTQFDPVLPLPLLNMGWLFNRKYREFTRHVMTYNSLTWGRNWYTRGYNLVRAMCKDMTGDYRFSEDEKRYFCQQLNITLVKPTREE